MYIHKYKLQTFTHKHRYRDRWTGRDRRTDRETDIHTDQMYYPLIYIYDKVLTIQATPSSTINSSILLDTYIHTIRVRPQSNFSSISE